MSDDSGSTSYGSVGGAPTKDGDFSWMCSGNQKICSASDAGVFYPHLEYGHQCVWYAWNRLAMIHGNEGWSWVMGNGGDIANNLKGQSGWTVDGNLNPVTVYQVVVARSPVVVIVVTWPWLRKCPPTRPVGRFVLVKATVMVPRRSPPMVLDG